MTSAAESITESLRRSRQMMVQVSTPARLIDMMYANDFLSWVDIFLCLQEVERSANTLSTFGKFLCD
jgi:hypothetical protein